MYNSASEVVREGLRLLKEQDELKELRLKELKKDIQKGYDSASNGNVGEWNLNQFKDKVRARGSNGKNGKSLASRNRSFPHYAALRQRIR